jgi:hypothetical protein
MLTYFKPVLFIFLALIATTQAEEKVFFTLDDRAWKIGFEDFSKDQTNVEMVLENETVLEWSELFSIQSFAGLEATAKEFAQTLEKTTQDKSVTAGNKEIGFKWVEQDPLDIVEMAFIAQDPKESDEYNIGRVIEGKENIYYLLYSSKDKQKFEESKQAWIERLKKAYVADEAKEGQTGEWFRFSGQNIYKGNKELPYDKSPKKVEDKTAGFTLTLPADWIVKNEEEKNTGFDPDHPETVETIFFNVEQNLYGGIAFFDFKNFDPKTFDPVQRYFELYKKNSPDIEQGQAEEIKTDAGDQGRLFVLKEGDETALIAFFEKQGRFYRIELWAPKDQFDALKPSFKQIISSFHISS